MNGLCRTTPWSIDIVPLGSFLLFDIFGTALGTFSVGFLIGNDAVICPAYLNAVEQTLTLIRAV